jgi:hypothetical protein
MLPDYPHLEYVQITEHECGVTVDVFEADFGDGYYASAVVGSTAGTKDWNITYGHLSRAPHRTDGRFSRESVADYLWDFYVARRAEGNSPFIIRDPRTRKFYLAGFVDTRLGYKNLRERFYTTGLQVKQRRVKGVAENSDGSLAEVE